MNKIITKIEVGKKNKERVNVFINDDFAFACSADLVYYYNLEKGKIVDLDLLKDVLAEDNYIKCKSYALRIIERSYKSEKEMAEKLLARDYDEKTIARIIDFLKEYNFINDEKYAEMFIKDKSISIGRNKIRYMLKRKGIEDSLIENKLTILEEDVEEQSALKLAQKKLDILKKSEANIKNIYKKIGDYLISKGYNFDVVTSTLNKVMDIYKIDINESTKIDESESEASEENLCTLKQLAEKRYRIVCKLEQDKKKICKKLSDYLIRRGYNWKDIKKILKEIIEYE